ncbi:hypothetical protein [Archaeoglobus neptunius]|uniref:hypothetical protein n=1 Tax=Archaeoglobus neptunius TaxID=2798580 RepID=UPI0019264716|nr:hypothetical protein [Archaeoglobus neptunius]
MKELGETALKLEEYRVRIVQSLSWVIFGVLFASSTMLFNALILLGISGLVVVISLLMAGFIGFIAYTALWKYISPGRGVRKKNAAAIIVALTAPFLISYSILPLVIHTTQLYYSVVWYPSLGSGLLAAGLISRRSRTMLYAGITLIFTSMIFIYLPAGSVTPLVANLLAISMMLAVYLVAFLHEFITAERVIYI